MKNLSCAVGLLSVLGAGGCSLLGIGGNNDNNNGPDMAKPAAMSLVASGKQWSSLGYLPLPGGILGVDGRANLKIRDFGPKADGGIRAIFSSVTQSQQDPITRWDWGTLKDKAWTSEMPTTDTFGKEPTGVLNGEFYQYTSSVQELPGSTGKLQYTLKVTTPSTDATWEDPQFNNYFFGRLGLLVAQKFTLSDGKFYFPFMTHAGLSLTAVSGASATVDGEISNWTNPQIVGEGAVMAMDGTKQFIAYCETEYGTHASTVVTRMMVMKSRDGGAGAWTELSREVHPCALGAKFGLVATGGTPKFIYLDDTAKTVGVLTPATATTFTATTIAVPTTDAINLTVENGQAVVGFSDSGAEGKATLAKVDGAALTPVGTAGFTTEMALVGGRYLGGKFYAVLVNQSALALEVVVQQ